MRPLGLKIAGLNSFRETQEINFAKLCETGVFGIFGPTGSGKSTILDAITLALYGTVERAANNTQGILNHAEDQLTVEFSFSLAAGSKRKTYRAERAYRRSGDRTVKASTCRFVEIAEGVETVLASKADEMTNKMEELLGLSVDDFTRAVVLPQGKFAEFLTIKPKDRRQMLERLFSLEAYGKELSARLTAQLGTTEFNLNGVEQRQQGLGDASVERVKEAEADLQEATNRAVNLTRNLVGLKLQYDEAKEVWGLQEQLRQIVEKEIQLTTQQPKIERMAERLSLAERAETIRPILEEINVLEERFRRAKGQFADAEAKLITARKAKEGSEEKWSEANLKRLEAEPRCLRRLEQLRQARDLEVDIQSREERLNNARLKYGTLDRTRKDLDHKIQVQTVNKEDVQKKMLELRDQLTQITVDPEQRARVNASAQALEAYEIVSQQVVGLQKDLEKNATEREAQHLTLRISAAEVQNTQEVVGQLKEVLALRQQNPPFREELLSERAQELERYRNVIANIERVEQEELEEQKRWQAIAADCQKTQENLENSAKEQAVFSVGLQEMTAYVEQKTAEVKRLEQENLAGLLVESLVEGEPCPVCGSVHHPKPAQSLANESVSKARNELEQASETLRELEGKRTDGATALAVAKARLSSKQDLERSQLKIVETKKQASLDYRLQLSEYERLKDVLALNAQRGDMESSLAKDKLLLKQWKIEQEQLTHQLEEVQQKLAAADKKQNSLQALAASTEGVGKEIHNRLQLLLDEQAQRQQRLDTLRGSILPADILGLQKQYAAWDQTIKTLTEEIAGLEESLKILDEAQQHLMQEKRDCELELENLKTVGSEAARQIADLKIKCEALTGGKPALEMTQQVEQELAQVVGHEEKLKKDFEQAKKVWNEAEQTLAVSSRTLELAKEGYLLAQHKLEKGLQTSQFLTAAAAESALCDEAERLKLEQEIAAFRQDVVMVKQKRADSEEGLKGRSLRPEEWLAWPLRLKEAEKAHTQASEGRGAAQQRLEKLKSEHEEWVRLEQERQALVHRRSLLKTLQSVFKGNAFVEFIAQEQLTNVSLNASERLKQLTNQRYALEVDADGGFIMRDDANGGVRRPVSSLSGGETFLTALALALALSTQIQLRGESPLEFFFLDEGFGTLDANLLETVMNTLEKLHLQNLAIGIISHVPELKNRLARRLLVIPAEAGGVGSRVRLELA